MNIKKLENIRIAIDGPAGAGKSTIAKLLSERLNIKYVDTGAIYRAYTWKAMDEDIEFSQLDNIIEMIKENPVAIYYDDKNNFNISLSGKNINEEIRTPEVTENISKIAVEGRVREILVKRQQELSKPNVIMDGRDIGTVVLPDADYKFYLDADVEKRAERRIKDLQNKGYKKDIQSIKEDIEIRDAKDRNRKVGPLKKADDAHYIDTTKLTIEEVIERLLSIIDNGENDESRK